MHPIWGLFMNALVAWVSLWILISPNFFFSFNVNSDVEDEVLGIINVCCVLNPKKYLGYLLWLVVMENKLFLDFVIVWEIRMWVGVIGYYPKEENKCRLRPHCKLYRLILNFVPLQCGSTSFPLCFQPLFSRGRYPSITKHKGIWAKKKKIYTRVSNCDTPLLASWFWNLLKSTFLSLC